MPRAASVSARFRRVVWAHYAKHGRHDLPWRFTRPLPTGRQAYKILVSEVMLQQTQVERVKPHYEAFLKKYPTARRLAAAPLSDVLKAWQGLGYNRRAKMLHAAAKQLGKSDFPKIVAELEQLPGVGKYTARAVAVFAFSRDAILIETNIRTAVLHHFFPRGRRRTVGNTIIYDSVSDSQIEEVLQSVRPKVRAKIGVREWNWALMDYGAFLKQSGVKLNAKSKHYTKQSKFSGSLREARGAILKELAKGSASKKRLLGLLGDDRVGQLTRALEALTQEGFIVKEGSAFGLSGE